MPPAAASTCRGALRQALTDAAALPGPDTITFASGLGPIVLGSEIVIADADGVTVDASALPSGVTVDGGAGTNRIFSVSAGANVTLLGLTLTGGNVAGATVSGSGGAIYNAGSLTAARCTFTENTASASGGAIRNAATLALTDCTLSANNAGANGGALTNDSTASFTRCTFSGNTSDATGTAGGAINHAFGALSLTLTHCTITGNSVTSGAGTGGGGIRNRGSNLTLNYCLIAGNTNAITGAGTDVNSNVAYTLGGANLIQTAVTGGGPATGPAPITTAPTLGTLANNGGPTQTHALLPGSAGIDAATGSTATADQRGIVISGTPDLGAFEFVGGLNVTATADSGPGSLRAAVANAALLPGPDTITFASGFTGPIVLTGGEIVIASDVTIDASNVPGGVTISGNNANRIFSVSSGKTVALLGLTLTGGDVVFGDGGAIYNHGGTVMLTHCSLSGNSADSGGAIYNDDGTLTLTNSIVAGNTAGPGGAIFNDGTLTLTHCTLSGNSASYGGAIKNHGPLTLAHCTVAGNSASSGGSGQGGGIYAGSGAGAAVTLTNSIVAGNSADPGRGADIFNYATLTRVGANIVQTLVDAGGGSGTGPAAINAPPRLAPLADNGGPTKTMALLPGSPALDAATVLVPALPTDQRGFPRNRDGDGNNVALPDIGAYEAQAAPFALGFNFVGGGPAASTGTLLATDTAGVPAFPQANWNNLTTDYDGSSSGTAPNAANRNDATGATLSGLQLWWDAPNTYGQPAAGLTTPDLKLMGGYLDSNATGDGSAATNLYSTTNAQPFLALAGLPAAATLGGYKVIVYTDMSATDGRISRYWLTSNRGQNPASVGGESALTGSYFTRDTSNFAGTYTRATATTDTGATTPGGNYVVFENLTEPGGFIVRAEEGSLPASNQARAPINAVQIIRNEILVVTTTADENDPSGTPGTGLSLREALRDAPDGAGIVFDSALSGATLTLTAALGGEIVIEKNVTIDASSLPGGVTISGGGTSRLFCINSVQAVALHNLTLTGGNGVGTFGSASGGAIYSDSALTLTQCTLSGNSAGSRGGAISNHYGTLTLRHCTLAGNSAGDEGGAINSSPSSTLTLTHCTLSGNHAGFQGGAVYNIEGALTLANSIVAGNTAPSGGSDIYNLSVFFPSIVTRVGTNLVQSLDHANDVFINGAGVAGTGTISTAPPLLAPLAAYGGPTQTMALRPTSPARNAATNSTITSDQRGFPIVGGTPDIGAYEAGTLTNCPAYLAETLPATATAAQIAPGYDFDGDGATNEQEWAALTDPASAASVFRITSAVRSGGNLILTFPSATGRTYRLERNDTLAPAAWVNTGLPAVSGNGSVKQFTVPASSPARRFFRVATP